MHAQRHIPGPTVCGFYDLFEQDYGDASTPKPYPRITPTCVGSAVLPFRCPRCSAVIDFTSPTRRAHYRDDRTPRVNHFCPACGLRFYLNTAGRPLTGPVDASGAAPAVVERVVTAKDGTVDVQREVQTGEASVVGGLQAVCEPSTYLLGCDLLGAALVEETGATTGETLPKLPLLRLVVDVVGVCVAGTALALTLKR